jgi:hypothetical protein
MLDTKVKTGLVRCGDRSARSIKFAVGAMDPVSKLASDMLKLTAQALWMMAVARVRRRSYSEGDNPKSACPKTAANGVSFPRCFESSSSQSRESVSASRMRPVAAL